MTGLTRTSRAMRSTSAEAWASGVSSRVRRKYLPWADVGHALVVHAAEGLLYGLALGVEHGAFEGDEDVGFHWVRL